MRTHVSRISTLAGFIVALTLVATSNGLPEVFAVHSYTASISPTVVTVNTSSTFTLTLTNASEGELPRRLGSFTVAIPSSFTNPQFIQISPPAGKDWTCTLASSTLSCRAIDPPDRLYDGESMTVSVSATPNQASVLPFQWTVTAYHFRGFSNPIPLNGPQPSVTVTGLGFIKIVKDTDPEPDPTDFSFTSTTLSPSNFQLDDDGAGNNPLSNSKTFNNLPAGIYNVSETPAAGYITNAVCSDGSPISAINLGPGEFITCTFTNSQPGTITIVKDAVPDDPTDFSFVTLGSGLSNFSLDDDGDNSNGLSNEITFQSLGSGSYTITEIVPLDWGVAGIDCETAGGTTFSVAGDSVIISLVGSGSAECTFTDVRLGSITVIKDTAPNDATAFSFTSSTLSPNNFQLDDDGDNSNALSNTRLFNNLLPGTYNLAETANPSYQTLAECSDGSPISAIALESAENITCTFTNSKVGTITIIKDAEPDNEQDFSFAAMFLDDESFTLDDDGDNGNELSNQVSFTLVPDTYSVSEIGTFGWGVSSIDCETTNGTTFSPSGDTVTITLTADGTAVCTFTNTPVGSGGSDGGLFRGRSFAFGIGGSANFDDQPPTIGNVLIQSGSLKVVAEIRDNVGVQDAKLFVGAAAYPMTRYEGNAFYWVGIVPNEDLAGNRVSFLIVARDYNNNVAEHAGSAEVEEPVAANGPRASFAVKPLSSSVQPAAYSISATGVKPTDLDQNANPQITITNTSTETLENIRLILSPELKGKFLLSDYAIKSIAPNSEFTVSMKLNGKPNVDEMGNPIPYYGQVIIVVDNGTPNVLELSGDIPNESSMLHSIFMKNIASKGEQRYKSFEKPEQRISGAEYAVRLGSGETVVRSASEELIISNTSDKPLKNLRIMTSSIGNHFLPDTKNIEVLPAGSFVKVKLVSKLNNAETRGLSGEIIIAPENGVPVTVPVEIGATLREDKNTLYEVSTVSGNGAISNTADGIIIKNNSEESIDNVRIILPQQLARVFSISEDSFKSIEPNSEVTVSLQQRGTVDSSVKQILNDYSGDIIIVSSDGMKKTIPVRIAWKGISSEHFIINARDNAEELTKATQVINFLERSYAETANIVGETNTKTVIYMTSSLDEVKLLSDALAPSTYVFNEDVALIWSDSEDVNTLALKEFTYRSIMNNYGTYWAKQKVSLDKGNWLVDGIANYVTSGIVGERGIIKEQLEAFVAEPTSFQWYGASTAAEHGASYSLFKFLVREYGDGIIDRTLKNLGSTMVSNNKCDSIEQCALLRAVYEANGMNINDKRHELNFAAIVEEWKTYLQSEHGISEVLD